MCLPGSFGFFVEAIADFFGLSNLSGLEIMETMSEVGMVVQVYSARNHKNLCKVTGKEVVL